MTDLSQSEHGIRTSKREEDLTVAPWKRKYWAPCPEHGPASGFALLWSAAEIMIYRAYNVSGEAGEAKT